MDTSRYVTGIKPPDDRWKQMKAIYDACKVANVCIPEEVTDFFRGVEPDRTGVTVPEGDNAWCVQTKRWSENGQHHIEVDLKTLPEDVTILRFSSAI
jgi:hypothetical protein